MLSISQGSHSKRTRSPAPLACSSVQGRVNRSQVARRLCVKMTSRFHQAALLLKVTSLTMQNTIPYEDSYTRPVAWEIAKQVQIHGVSAWYTDVASELSNSRCTACCTVERAHRIANSFRRSHWTVSTVTKTSTRPTNR